jgi:ABC-type phosphate transport system substrate-binding protein
MRRLVVAAATAAATLATLGLTATAQAQPASLAALKITGPASAGIVVGIPTGFQEAATPTTAKCTWSITPALPKTVTLGTGGTNSCTALIDGVWTTPKTTTYTVKVTAGGSSATKAVKVTAANSPAENDATGVGSDTIQNVLDQFGADYNPTVSATSTHIYSWDATNPLTGAIGDSIAEKTGCSSIPRPDGSSAGITQLATFQKTHDGKFFCSSFARSSRARASSDPAFAPGGIAFVDLAGDAVTWSAQATTNAPATLTTAQLAAIYNCTDTNWSQVGGANAPIHAFIPQSGSGTRAFFLGAIGIATPGSCVSDDNGLLEENEGVNPVLKDPDAIFPYSTGKFIAEKFHSDLCITKSTCAPNASGIVCKHTPGKNLFGCDTHGTMALKKINGVAPTTGSGANTVINGSFPATFQRIVFEVVPFDPSTTDHIPGSEAGAPGGVNLEALFGASGFTCSNAKAKTDLKNYGFLVTPLCGVTG